MSGTIGSRTNRTHRTMCDGRTMGSNWSDPIGHHGPTIGPGPFFFFFFQSFREEEEKAEVDFDRGGEEGLGFGRRWGWAD
uniref:Uncharacterized protein n=1 Tax=Cannabis sativa TaxID=3483 RepID=A0A803PLP8_CANSA